LDFCNLWDAFLLEMSKLIIINNLFSKTILLTIAQILLYHFTHTTIKRAIQFSLKTYFFRSISFRALPHQRRHYIRRSSPRRSHER
jgi:hypothetical protein